MGAVVAQKSPIRISLPRSHCRVGLHIVLFEACSAFTHVAAYTLARSPIRGRYPKASDTSSPPCLLRLLPAGAVAGRGLHPLEKRRLFHGARGNQPLAINWLAADSYISQYVRWCLRAVDTEDYNRGREGRQIGQVQKQTMLNRRRLVLCTLTIPAIGLRAHAQSSAAANGPSSADVRALLEGYTGRGGESLGYVTGIIDGGGHRLIADGQSGATDARPLDGDSVFEIGSITKVFTALLMAEMAQRGEVHLDDPVAEYLPPEGRPRPYKDKPITLLDLATHTSGLPRLPANLKVTDPMHPYTNYTVAQLYEFLSGFSQQFYPRVHYQVLQPGVWTPGPRARATSGAPL